MADTLTLQIHEKTAEWLRQVAAETGESVEAAAQRVLDELASEQDISGSLLSEEQLADLDRRLKNPGPIASPEEVEVFFARFKAG